MKTKDHVFMIITVVSVTNILMSSILISTIQNMGMDVPAKLIMFPRVQIFCTCIIWALACLSMQNAPQTRRYVNSVTLLEILFTLLTVFAIVSGSLLVNEFRKQYATTPTALCISFKHMVELQVLYAFSVLFAYVICKTFWVHSQENANDHTNLLEHPTKTYGAIHNPTKDYGANV